MENSYANILKGKVESRILIRDLIHVLYAAKVMLPKKMSFVKPIITQDNNPPHNYFLLCKIKAEHNIFDRDLKIQIIPIEREKRKLRVIFWFGSEFKYTYTADKGKESYDSFKVFDVQKKYIIKFLLRILKRVIRLRKKKVS